MNICVTNRKKILFTLCVFLFILLYVLFAKDNVLIISESIHLFINCVLPSVYIFILFTEIIKNFGLVEYFSSTLLKVISKVFNVSKNSSIIIIIGFLFGYPNASKYISFLNSKGSICQDDITKLVSFTNNANISYILLGIGVGILKDIKIGIILAISHYLSSIIIGIIQSFSFSKSIIQQNIIFSNIKTVKIDKFEMFKQAIKNSIITLMYVFSYMIIFTFIPSFIINIFSFIPISELVKGVFIGIFELTSGIDMLSSINISINLKVCIISFILSFSSLMVIFQIYTYLSSCKIKLSKILLYKLFHGILSFIITYFILSLNFISLTDVTPVFSSVESNTLKNFITNPYMIIICLSHMLLITILLVKKARGLPQAL